MRDNHRGPLWVQAQNAEGANLHPKPAKPDDPIYKTGPVIGGKRIEPSSKAKPKAKKPKKKAKKVLTPEEKEKAEIKELKNMALLKGPSLLPETLWSVYVADNLPSGQGKLTDKIKEVASRFSGLSEYEKDVSFALYAMPFCAAA